MYQRILVPVDLGHGAVAAHIVRVARWLAGEQGQVTLLHVMDKPPAYVSAQVPAAILDEHRAETRRALDALAAAAGVQRTLLVEGSAASAILEQAARDAVDAIVLGSHRPDYRDYLIGSTAARVVRHAACTVIVERSWTEA
ncbi:MAG TPA: universal stress protein [Amaricoccus sp.]|jgi:nucleotide-binding universal stress UspA family protein|nr:universal stress protein [Amaricoccus sp.]